MRWGFIFRKAERVYAMVSKRSCTFRDCDLGIPCNCTEFSHMISIDALTTDRDTICGLDTKTVNRSRNRRLAHVMIVEFRCFRSMCVNYYSILTIKLYQFLK